MNNVKLKPNEVKLADDEMAVINEHDKNIKNIILQIGQLEYEVIQKQALKNKKVMDIQGIEKEVSYFLSVIEKKYGSGHLNTETGVLTLQKK